MNAFNEIYNKIIIEANELENTNNYNTYKKAFNQFIGKKFITGYLKIDRTKNINENKFIIKRATIKDIKIEKDNHRYSIIAIFDNPKFRTNLFNISGIRLRDCTPEKFAEKLKQF